MRIVGVLFIFLCSFAYARPAKKSEKISNVVVSCSVQDSCEALKGRLQSLVGFPIDPEIIKQSLKNVLSSSEIEALSFQIVYASNGPILEVYTQNLPIVRSVSFEGGGAFDFLKIKSLLNVREGEYFKQEQVNDSKATISKILEESGHLSPSIDVTVKKHAGTVDLQFSIKTGDVTEVKDIDVISSDEDTRLLLKRRLSYFVGGAWSGYEFNLRLGQINEAFLREGYLFSKIQMVDYNWLKDQNKIIPRVEAYLGKKFLFSFFGNTVFSRQELIKSFKDVLGKSVNSLESSALEAPIVNLYKSKGYYNVKLSTKVQTIKLRTGKEETTHFFIIEEGVKLPLAKLTFDGNQHFPNDFLQKFVKKEASVLVSRGFYDENFFADLPNKLKKLYWSHGFLFVNIIGPNLHYGKDQKNISITYRISEGNKTTLDKISFIGLSPELTQKVESKIVNKAGSPFNPEALAQDQDTIINELQSNGYFYAAIKNQNEENLLTYSNGFSKAALLFDIDLRDIIKLDHVLIVGNVKTKNYVIEREINIKQGEIITPLVLEQIRYALNSLGLFSSIKIVPLEDSDKDGLVNLLVSLKERNFGSVELTPGFRTDLGVKLGVGGAYNNLWGTNRTISLKTQVNQRTNLDTLDSRRREQKKKVIEYSNQFSYNEPYLFGYPVSLGAGFNSSRRRLRAFDTNIIRSNVTVSKIFTKAFSGSLRYQFENSSQTNATDPLKDEGSFTVGGLTPSISLDFRNNRINPQKGAFFNLSTEVANPYLLSQKNEVIEINFFKLVSRNRFYYPFSLGVLALSYSVGYQQNLAREHKQDPSGNIIEERKGRIPSIKTFRLNGMDIVRGFADSEINMLDNGKDINDVIVDNGAYFTNLKLEPRFLVDDNVMVGLFLDGGKVYLNSFDPLSLRTSAGVSLKYITPVGSLDFDFGVKLHRRRLPDGNLESPSRIHLSIGFF